MLSVPTAKQVVDLYGAYGLYGGSRSDDIRNTYPQFSNNFPSQLQYQYGGYSYTPNPTNPYYSYPQSTSDYAQPAYQGYTSQGQGQPAQKYGTQAALQGYQGYTSQVGSPQGDAPQSYSVQGY